MGSTFGGLHVASSAMAAQRLAIETAGQNIANVNTPGYSRQRVELAARSSSAGGLHTGNSIFGMGVDVVGQTRIVDAFLNQRVGGELAGKGYADQVAETLRRVELALGEPGETGLATQLGAFWNAWDAVVNTPQDLAARTALLQRAGGVTDMFTDLTTQLDGMARDVLQRAAAVAIDVNGMAGQVAALNGEIAHATNMGLEPNELLDQRDELVRQLSTNAGVRATTRDDGMVDVAIGGASLVSGTRNHELSLDTSTPGAAVLRLSNSTIAVTPGDGALRGLLESANVLIPGQQAALDGVAVALADVVNTQHALGQDLTGTATGAFFSATSARDIVIDPSVAGQPERVGAATLGAGLLDGSNAAAMAARSGVPGGPDDRYRSMVTQLGVQAATANRRVELQDRMTEDALAQSDAVSGVSIDEEMTNLVAHQHAYSAAARVLTTVDEMLDVLINRTGQIGR